MIARIPTSSICSLTASGEDRLVQFSPHILVKDSKRTIVSANGTTSHDNS